MESKLRPTTHLTLSSFKTLVKIAASDGWFDEAEISYLYKRGKAMGLSRVEISEILRDKGIGDFELPESKHQQILLVYELACLMVIDFDLDQKEHELYLSLCMQMCIEKEMAVDIMNCVEDANEYDELNERVLAKILDKYADA